MQGRRRRRRRRPRGPVPRRGARPRARARRGAASTSPRPPSTAPTSCSGRASTRRRRAPPTSSASSAAAPSPRSARASTGWSVGDEVCALLAGGGYAERVAVPAGQLMPLPRRRRPGHRRRAARGRLHGLVERVHGRRACGPEEHFLVHGGAGGIGTMAIQLAHALGARVYATAGSAEKLALCAELGADVAINYREEDFVEVVRRETDGHGADVILDNMGAKYLRRNVDALAARGPAGRDRDAGRDQGRARPRRAPAQAGRGHRHRPAVAARRGQGGDLRRGRRARLAAGRGRAGAPDRAHRTLPLAQAAEAHALLESGDTVGKVAAHDRRYP